MIFSWPRDITASIAFLGIFLWSACTYAQEKKTYDGPLVVGDYEGTASFSYIESDSDSLLTGVFSFESTGPENLATNQSAFVSVLGNFNAGTPHGWWEFHRGTYTPSGTTSLVDNRYQVNVSGERHLVRGLMTNGKPHGEWVNYVEVLENSVVTRTPFRSSIEFANGIPRRSFRMGNERMTLVGRFLRNGFAHDTWELYSRNNAGALEEWQFREGALSQISLYGPEADLEISFPQVQGKNSLVVNMDEHYMRVVRLMIRIYQNSNVPFQSQVYDLLEENTSYYDKTSSLFAELGYASFTPEFKVKVPYIPLTETETIQIDSIRSLTEQASEWNKLLGEDTQLQILALTNNEVELLLEVNKYLGRNILRPLSQLLEYHDQDILAHVPRAEVLRVLGLTETMPGPLAVQVGEDSARQTFQGPVIPVGADQTALSIAYQQARYTYQSLDSIGRVLDISLSLHKREQRLASLEEQMILASNELHAHADTVAKNLNPALTRAVRTLEQTARDHLEDYSGYQGTDKLTQAANMITCFEQIDELILVIARQPLQWEKILEAYTDEVWNPFTATVMEEQVKRRILEAYQNVLLPDFLARIDEGIACEDIDTFIFQVASTHKRLFEMIGEDTRRLERKLKRETNPKTILRLFGIGEGEEESP